MGTYDGTVVGTPTFVAAKFGNGLKTTSESSYIRLPNALFQFAGAWTIEAWLKDGAVALRVAVTSGVPGGNTIWIGTTADGKFAASFDPVDTAAVILTSDVASNDGNWHHVAMVNEGSVVKFYVNGTLKDTENHAPAVPNVGATYYGSIGRFYDITSYLWSGIIDEVAFWDSARYTANFTPAPAAYAGTEANLRALYHLEADGTDGETDSIVTVGTPLFGEYGPNTLSFSWTAGSGGTAPYTYQVQISTNGVDYTDEGAPQSGLTYSDTGLTASTTYYYRIVATDATDVSGTGEAASKATLATGLKYNRRDLTGTASARAIMVLIPNANSDNPYDSGTATPLLIYHHGSGEDDDALLDDALKATTTTALLDAGYICCGISAMGNNWGNQAACDCYPDLYNTVAALYNLSYTLFLSQSMGGLTGLLTLAQNEIPSVVAWAGIYPACNLEAIYDAGTFTAAINTAYSCVAATYDAKTFGHDPCDKWGKAFRNVPMRFYASPADTTIVKSTNTDVFQAIVSTSTTESTIVVCSGVHGDTSHFQPSDLVAFYERALANPVSTSGLGGGAVSIQPIIGRLG